MLYNFKQTILDVKIEAMTEIVIAVTNLMTKEKTDAKKIKSKCINRKTWEKKNRKKTPQKQNQRKTNKSSKTLKTNSNTTK